MAATVKATKRSAVRRPTPAPAPETSVLAPEPGGFEVLRLTTSTKADEDRVPLFYIDDKAYTIPKRPRMNIALQFMHLAKGQGDAVALDYLLGKLLGDEGYRALREYDDLLPEQFTQITEIASRLTLGALELPKA